MAGDPLLTCWEQLDAAGEDLGALLRSLRALKTTLVGNKARKVACCQDLARLRRLVKVLQLGGDDAVSLAVKTQAVTILGILALPNEDVLLGLLTVDAPSALWSIFRALSSVPTAPKAAPREARDLFVATLRALRSLYAVIVEKAGPRTYGAIILTSRVSTGAMRAGKMRTRVDRLPASTKSALAEAFKHDNVLCLVHALIASTAALASSRTEDADDMSTSTWTAATASSWHLAVAELCCNLIGSTVRTREQQVQLLSDENAATAALAALASLVQVGHVRVEEAALNALSAVVHDFAEASMAVFLSQGDRTWEQPVHSIMAHLDSRVPSVQLAAARCCAHLFRADPKHDATFLPKCRPVISTLLRLISERDGFEAQATAALAYIVANSEPLQCAACEFGAMRILAKTISWDNSRMLSLLGITSLEEEDRSELLIESCLVAIAQLTLLRDDLRRLVTEEKLNARLVGYLSWTSVPIRRAAAECVRALSRSSNILRSGLMDAGVANPLLDLLDEAEDEGVRVTALTAVSNLVLDCSPMKQVLISRDILPKLVAIAQAHDGMLRVRSLGALRNAIYYSASPLKQMILSCFTNGSLMGFAQDADPEVQEQALNIIRNLACSNEADIVMTVYAVGESRLYNLLEEKLRSSHEQVVIQALYVIVNVATGDELHRRSIMMRPAITRALLAHMAHPQPEVRVGAIWCIHNLARGVHDNVVRLRGLGFEARLRDMTDDLSLDVRERVAETLHVLGAS